MANPYDDGELKFRTGGDDAEFRVISTGPTKSLPLGQPPGGAVRLRRVPLAARSRLASIGWWVRTRSGAQAQRAPPGASLSQGRPRRDISTVLSARLSKILLALGATVGVLTVAILALELRINFPDWMIRVAMAKLALIASAGLLGAGAIIGRHAKRQSRQLGDESLGLVEGASDLESSLRERDAVERDRR